MVYKTINNQTIGVIMATWKKLCISIGYLSTTDYIDVEILHGWTGGNSGTISILGILRYEF